MWHQVLDQRADAVSFVSRIRQHDGTRAEVVKHRVCDLFVVCLSCRQAAPDREALRVNDNVDLGREPAA